MGQGKGWPRRPLVFSSIFQSEGPPSTSSYPPLHSRTKKLWSWSLPAQFSSCMHPRVLYGVILDNWGLSANLTSHRHSTDPITYLETSHAVVGLLCSEGAAAFPYNTMKVLGWIPAVLPGPGGRSYTFHSHPSLLRI